VAADPGRTCETGGSLCWRVARSRSFPELTRMRCGLREPRRIRESYEVGVVVVGDGVGSGGGVTMTSAQDVPVQYQPLGGDETQ
jgi:predicted phosphoribosyltransferase